jgi:hypothetical protein
MTKKAVDDNCNVRFWWHGRGDDATLDIWRRQWTMVAADNEEGRR